MKKFISVLMAAFFIFSATPMMKACYAGSEVVYQDNAFDNLGDWMATMGKDKEEKDMVIAQRKADRQAKHAAKMAEKMKKEAEQNGKDMKKSLGF